MFSHPICHKMITTLLQCPHPQIYYCCVLSLKINAGFHGLVLQYVLWEILQIFENLVEIPILHTYHLLFICSMYVSMHLCICVLRILRYDMKIWTGRFFFSLFLVRKKEQNLVERSYGFCLCCWMQNITDIKISCTNKNNGSEVKK